MLEMIPLTYRYDAFEPIISTETMRNHYEILYKGYVDKFNKVVKQLEVSRNKNEYKDIKCLEHELSYQGGGAMLHDFFFENITPFSNSKISADLFHKIIEDFGSEKAFKEQFNENCANIEGSGWGILGYSPKINKLLILQCEKHQNLTIWNFLPILVIDVWEHAYYLDYQTNKKAYLENIFHFIDWEVVSNRYGKVIN